MKKFAFFLIFLAPSTLLADLTSTQSKMKDEYRASVIQNPDNSLEQQIQLNQQLNQLAKEVLEKIKEFIQKNESLIDIKRSGPLVEVICRYGIKKSTSSEN